MKAYIRYFDNLSGRGVVRIADSNIQAFIHYSALKDDFQKKFITFDSYEALEVTLYEGQVDTAKRSNWTNKDEIVSDLLIKNLESNPDDDFYLYNLITVA